MPSFQDSAVIFFIALLLFGPKKLPELARYVGKLMGEFRRASSEFRIQMEDEFRLSEQAEQQKKIAAMEAAAPVPPVPAQDIPEPEHPHLRTEVALEEAPSADPIPEHRIDARVDTRTEDLIADSSPDPNPAPAPLPIASHGDLHMMPPATGLPAARSSSLAGVFDSIPQTTEPETHA